MDGISRIHHGSLRSSSPSCPCYPTTSRAPSFDHASIPKDCAFHRRRGQFFIPSGKTDRRADSVGWRFAFCSFSLRISQTRKGIRSTRKDMFIIVAESESPEDSDQESDVKQFFKTLQPAEVVKESSTGFWTWNPLKVIDRISDHADAQTELGMRKRRAFYAADDWTKHRSSKRHLRHILSTFKSRVIISLIPPVTTLTFISIIVATYNTLVDEHILPAIFPVLHTSSLPYQLTAPALALLLVFRTEASYSRYDEARKTWTSVFARTKDFSRQCLTLVKHPDDHQRKIDLQHYIMAFPVALKCHLLDEADLYHDLKLLLDEDDLQLVMNSSHRPNYLIQLMTQSLSLLRISEGERILMDQNITQFNESVSVCERIIRSPIPLSYTRLTSRALILWHLTYPFVLWDECKWMMVFATFFSASTLFCIEEVGVLIEEPFPMLSLERMCVVAHQNVQDFVMMSTETDRYLRNKEKKLSSQVADGPGKFGRAQSNGAS